MSAPSSLQILRKGKFPTVVNGLSISLSRKFTLFLSHGLSLIKSVSKQLPTDFSLSTSPAPTILESLSLYVISFCFVACFSLSTLAIICFDKSKLYSRLRNITCKLYGI